jgi:hypothetical protein
MSELTQGPVNCSWCNQIAFYYGVNYPAPQKYISHIEAQENAIKYACSDHKNDLEKWLRGGPSHVGSRI